MIQTLMLPPPVILSSSKDILSQFTLSEAEGKDILPAPTGLRSRLVGEPVSPCHPEPVEGRCGQAPRHT